MSTEEDFYIELGANIAVIRNSKGINQETLADFLKLSRPSIANMEKGRQKPSIITLALIANYLKVDISKIIPIISDVEVADLKMVGADFEAKNKNTNESLNSFLQTLIKIK